MAKPIPFHLTNAIHRTIAAIISGNVEDLREVLDDLSGYDIAMVVILVTEGARNPARRRKFGLMLLELSMEAFIT